MEYLATICQTESQLPPLSQIQHSRKMSTTLPSLSSPSLPSPPTSTLSSFEPSPVAVLRGAGGINLLEEDEDDDSQSSSPSTLSQQGPLMIPPMQLPESAVQSYFHALYIPFKDHVPTYPSLTATQVPQARVISQTTPPPITTTSPLLSIRSHHQYALSGSSINSPKASHHPSMLYSRNAVDKPHACTFCSSRFTRRHDFLRHLKTVHKSEEQEKPKNCVCRFCNNAFSRPDSLRRHERRCTEASTA